jgi:hypothetical protein
MNLSPIPKIVIFENLETIDEGALTTNNGIKSGKLEIGGTFAKGMHAPTKKPKHKILKAKNTLSKISDKTNLKTENLIKKIKHIILSSIKPRLLFENVDDLEPGVIDAPNAETPVDEPEGADKEVPTSEDIGQSNIDASMEPGKTELDKSQSQKLGGGYDETPVNIRKNNTGETTG